MKKRSSILNKRPRGEDSLFSKKGNQGIAGGTEVPMHTLLYLSESQLERIKLFFPRSHGTPRVNGRRVVSGIGYVIKHRLQWREAPAEHGPHKNLYNRFFRWSKFWCFNKISITWKNNMSFDVSLMLDITYLKAHRTAASLLKKGSLHVSSVAQKED